MEAFLERYLSKKHCRQIADGCPLAALVSEVSRADYAVKASFEVLVRELVNELASHAAGPCGRDAEERAMAAVAVCVGGLGLARAVRDEGFAEKLMVSCRKMAARLLCAGAEPLEEKRAR